MLDMAHLATFSAVVDEGSFDAAARRLHLTPSAVSQRIKALESRMGRILVSRSRPVRPTDAGQVLMRLAGQITLLEREALADLDDAAGELRIPVAVNADSLATWFLPALPELASRGDSSPGMSFDIRQEDQDHSVALLRDGSVMAAVTTQARPVQGCTVSRLGSMRYLAVVAPRLLEPYRCGPGGVNVVAALGRIPMLVFNRKDALQERFVHDVAGKVLNPPVTYLPSSQGFVDAARLGLGWGMLPEQLAEPALTGGQLVQVESGRHLDVALYWQRWRLDSAVLDALTRAVRRAAVAALRVL